MNYLMENDCLDCFKSGGGRHKQGLRMLTGIGVHFFQQFRDKFYFLLWSQFFHQQG